MTKLFFILAVFSVTAFSCNKSTPPQSECNLNINQFNLSCDAEVYDATLNGFHAINYAGTSTKKSEGNLTNGVPNGFWKFYTQNGDLSMEGNYSNGKVDGFWKIYYANGNLREEGGYSNCIKTGFWKYYFEGTNNSVQYEGNYQNNSYSGTWRRYDLNGSTVEEYSCP